MDRYICIHGHFYQPPRENPWLEHIELQDSAHPYHDWNERITAECYAPNARSRILDGEQQIVEIVNNYSKISYNFGPTLLSWLEVHSPDTYSAIVAADHESARFYSGHGSAIAQAYNHMILPLAVTRDKYTQIHWGVQDFVCRFRRHPEGMWLPETAVDSETLAIMAGHGIKFTVLSPFQAARVRRIGTRAWREVHGGRVDPSMPYRVRLKSGKSMAVFFYDGPISTGVAFEGLLNRGEYLADRLVGAFSPERTWPQIVSIATDGETYGHHHRHGEMALSYALRYLKIENKAKLTNYAEFLENHPPFEEVEIIERSAWSCSHGVDRWTADCGCCSGLNGHWNQQWRTPLRAALDWLRDTLGPIFERQGTKLFNKPWSVRNDYVCVVIDRSPENVDSFLRGHCHRELRPDEKVRALKLLEMQRHAMLMYTSCGWFFDELSGIETVQILAYAARALQLAREVTGVDLEPRFLDLLEKAESNIPEHRNGRRIYQKMVKPAMVDLEAVGAHYAVSSLFSIYEDVSRIYAYTVERQDYRLMGEAQDRVVVGRGRITSDVTSESLDLTFGVVRIGEAGVGGGVRRHRGHDAYEKIAEAITAAFERGDVPMVIRTLDREFGAGTFGVRNLFRDDQRRIVDQILAETLQQAETMYRDFYRGRLPLMRFVTSLGLSLPSALLYAAQVTIKNGLRRCFESDTLDYEKIDALLKDARKTGVDVGSSSLEFALRRRIESIAAAFRQHPLDLPALQALEDAVDLTARVPFDVNVWNAQNAFYEVLSTVYRGREEARDVDMAPWLAHFRALGQKLSVRVD